MSIGERSGNAWRSTVVCACIALAGCGPGADGSEHGALLRLEVEPANAMLDYTGEPLEQTYTAYGTYEDGTREPVDDAVFSLDTDGIKLGSFTGPVFAVGGGAAGKGGVFATLGDVTGSTSVIVNMKVTTLGPGVPDNAADLFPDTAQPGALSQTIVYPLANAVMPTSVKAPMVQWEGTASGAGDLYRIRMVAGPATVDTIIADAPTASFLPPTIDWSRIVNTIGAGAATITVDHYDPVNGAHAGTPVPVKLIEANVVGAIYYWHLDAGRMERIDAMGRAPAIANPPPRSDGKVCIACHTVSRDGRYLAAALWDGGQQGAVFDMASQDVINGDPAPTVGPLQEGVSYTQLFATFNADATRLLVNSGNSLSLIDPMTSQPVTTSGTALPTAGAAHPSWSPDGSSIVYASETDGVWGVDYTSSNLSLISVPAPDTFDAPTQLVSNTTTTYTALSWPTWAPDSQWIAFGNGQHSRGNQDLGGGATARREGVLSIVKRDGTRLRNLAHACLGAVDCHLPNFSPFDEGGYYWMVFYSFKDYGNALAGTKGAARRQMWITAIDKSKLDTDEDPSSVPYWLPDQDVTAQNMSAYWAKPAPIQ